MNKQVCILTVLLTLVLSSIYAQTVTGDSGIADKRFELKDQSGTSALEISKINLYGRYSGYFKANVSDLSFVATLSDAYAKEFADAHLRMVVDVTIQKTDGSAVDYKATFDLESGGHATVHRPYLEYTSANFKSISFKMSPLFATLAERLEAREEEKREQAAEKLEAAQERARQARDHTRYLRDEAEREARKAAERARIQAACQIIYVSTANMKIKDLTVKEEQQVRACQALGLYKPS